MFGRKKGFDEPVEHIEATIIEVMSNNVDIDYLRLDNGHIW